VVAGPGSITYSVFDQALANQFYVMQSDGSGNMILSGSVVGDIDGHWSNDRTRIALANADENPAEVTGFNPYTDLVVMNADGSGRVRLTNHFGSVTAPAWSPDGSKIAFASDQSGRSEIYVVNADGSNRVQLTTTGGFAASWSPDGTRIAVGIKITDVVQQPSAFVMDASDGGNILPLMPGEDPAWSPDGSLIALATCPTVVCDPPDYRLTLMHPDGTGAVTMDTIPGVHQPAWAPDGSRIAVARLFPRFITGGIYTMNPDESGVVHLVGFLGYFPSWGP
jgi:TolB protein